MSELPQLDRLNDDATDQALRDIRPRQPRLNPANAPLPDDVAPVRPADLRHPPAGRHTASTRSTASRCLQLDLRQRWQTKRGFPGNSTSSTG